LLSTVALIGCKDKSSTSEEVLQEPNSIKQVLCPIMDEPINKDLYTEYKGKQVYFCCPGCKENFEKEPEKYLDKLPQFKK
jgi:YHS domain-containing protein